MVKRKTRKNKSKKKRHIITRKNKRKRRRRTKKRKRGGMPKYSGKPQQHRRVKQLKSAFGVVKHNKFKKPKKVRFKRSKTMPSGLNTMADRASSPASKMFESEPPVQQQTQQTQAPQLVQMMEDLSVSETKQ